MTLALQGSVETDDDFFLNALEGMERCEAGWRLRHKVWSWIDQKPTWVSAAGWDIEFGDVFPPIPTEQCWRRLRFSLICCGQVHSSGHWRARTAHPDLTTIDSSSLES